MSRSTLLSSGSCFTDPSCGCRMGAPSSHLQHPGLSGISEVLAYIHLGQKLESQKLVPESQRHRYYLGLCR